MSVVAITGATGFVGGHLLHRAVARGHEIRALARRPRPDLGHVEWIPGSLDDAASLATLVQGAEAVIHVAGMINAPSRAAFAECNVAGTERLIAAAKEAGIGRFIHVSSLAAREPEISDYGWSKSLSERLVEQSGLDWTIVRPPAVYGPGDRETLDLFRMAGRGFVLLPPRGRISLLHVADLADLLLACLDAPESVGRLYEPDDGTHCGWSHEDFARALGRARGRKVRAISIPKPVMGLGARLDRAARRDRAKLTPDRARYFAHPDWVARPERHPPAALWSPKILTETGLRDTVSWYASEGWLG